MFKGISFKSELQGNTSGICSLYLVVRVGSLVTCQGSISGKMPSQSHMPGGASEESHLSRQPLGENIVTAKTNMSKQHAWCCLVAGWCSTCTPGWSFAP